MIEAEQSSRSTLSTFILSVANDPVRQFVESEQLDHTFEHTDEQIS